MTDYKIIPINDQWQNSLDGNASGFVIKSYLVGTTTSTSMSIDQSGGTLVTSVTLNADGIPEVSGNEVKLYTNSANLRIAIYENSTDATNNTNAFYGPVDLYNLTETNSINKTFQTVALMVADTTLTVGDIVTTLGYFSPNDGGGNTYEIVAAGTGTADNGSYINLTGISGQAEAYFENDIVNVRQFGAVGDNSTDDFLKLQDAAAAAAGKVLLFPGNGIYLTSDNIDIYSDTIIDIGIATVTNSSNDAAKAAFHVDTKSNVEFKNGTIRVSGNGIGILCDNSTNLKFEKIDFQRGAKALIIEADYPTLTTDITITDCIHDGESSGGGFFTCSNASKINITGCNGKDGSEFFDFNNNVTYLNVSKCYSENYTENHWDVNSTRHAKFIANTLYSDITGLTNRLIFVSDTTLGTIPGTMTDYEQLSDDVVMIGNIIKLENWDYADCIVFNSATPTPSKVQKYIFSNNTIESIDQLSRDSIKFQGDQISFTITGNEFFNIGCTINGEHNTVTNNKFVKIGSELDTNIVQLKDWDGGIFNSNNFYNYTSQSDTASGGLVWVNTCNDALISKNNFVATTAPAAFFTETAGDENSYIENVYNVACTRPGGVRKATNTGKTIQNSVSILKSTFADGDTTPDISGFNVWKTANTSATTISNFDGATGGEQIFVIINDSNTAIDFTSSSLKGNGGADWTASIYDSMYCVFDSSSNLWHCVISG